VEVAKAKPVLYLEEVSGTLAGSRL